jgi:hypothetical protein
VHHGVDAVRAHHLDEAGRVADVSLLERRAGTLRRFAVSGCQVVVDDDVFPSLAERLDGVAADVTGAARDEHAHRRPIE